MAIIKSTAASLLALTSVCAIAHPISSGEELGASVRPIAGSDIRAEITLRPRLNFDRVTIALGSNSVGGERIVCDLGAVVAGQVYRCDVDGDVPDDDPGLIVNIVGVSDSPELHSGISRKSFSVLNPDYDRAADQKRQREAAQRSSRNTTLREPTAREKVR